MLESNQSAVRGLAGRVITMLVIALFILPALFPENESDKLIPPAGDIMGIMFDASDFQRVPLNNLHSR